MASYNNFTPAALPNVAATAVNPPAAPPSVYNPNFTPPSGASTGTQVQQGSSSGGGIGNVTNFLPTRGITSGINNIGGSLGFGTQAAAPAGFVGPMPMTGTLTNVPLSGVLGGAGVGGIVGALNPLAGGSTAGNVGGMVGGALGAALGFGLPGQVVGSFLGSSIGGIFGKKKPGVHLSEFQTGVLSGNNYTGATGFTSKRADKSQAESVHSDFTNYLNDIGTKYGLDFTGSAFRGGFNDLRQGGWFLAAKNDLSKGDPDVNPDAWTNYKFDPEGKDKYKTYAQVAGQMLASQGKLTKELADKLIADTQERMTAEQLNGAGLGGKQPVIPNANPSGKEDFNTFLARYRAGNLDAGPVTSARDIPPVFGAVQTKTDANAPAGQYVPGANKAENNPLLYMA